MKKFTKQLLTGVVALGLLVPVATQAVSNNPQTTVNAKRRHHRKAHSTRIVRGYWATKHHHHVWGLSFQNTGVAFMPNGAPISNWSHPIYKYDGHRAYSIKTSRRSINNAGRVRGENYYIKLRAHHHISVWTNGRYIGTYHKVSRHYLLG